MCTILHHTAFPTHLGDYFKAYGQQEQFIILQSQRSDVFFFSPLHLYKSVLRSIDPHVISSGPETSGTVCQIVDSYSFHEFPQNMWSCIYLKYGRSFIFLKFLILIWVYISFFFSLVHRAKDILHPVICDTYSSECKSAGYPLLGLAHGCELAALTLPLSITHCALAVNTCTNAEEKKKKSSRGAPVPKINNYSIITADRLGILNNSGNKAEEDWGWCQKKTWWESGSTGTPTVKISVSDRRRKPVSTEY